jgi:hypothetical protein
MRLKIITFVAMLALTLSVPAVAPAATLSAHDAKSAAAKYMWQHYGSYRHGSHRHITATRIAKTKFRCRATWQFRSHWYGKTVTVRAPSANGAL